MAGVGTCRNQVTHNRILQ